MPPPLRYNQHDLDEELERLRKENRRLKGEKEEDNKNLDLLLRELRNLGAEIKELKYQYGLLAHRIQARTSYGLPSNIVPNPKDQVDVITTTAGAELQMHGKDDQDRHWTQPQSPLGEAKVSQGKLPLHLDVTQSSSPSVHNEIRDENRYLSLLEKMSKLNINAFLLKAPMHIPSYGHLADCLINNESMVDASLEEDAVRHGGLLPKLMDPGHFSIPCRIGNIQIHDSLCDSGASVKLMPLYLFQHLGLEQLTPAAMSLQFANSSRAIPEGMAEDVLVRVGNFFVPTDFIVLDIEEDRGIPLILGRPFLATGYAIIDIHKGTLSLGVDGQCVTFNVCDTSNLYGEHATELPVSEDVGNMKGCHMDPPHTVIEDVEQKSHLGGNNDEKSSCHDPSLVEEFANSNLPYSNLPSINALPPSSICLNSSNSGTHVYLHINTNSKIIGKEREYYEKMRLQNIKCGWRVKEVEGGDGDNYMANPEERPNHPIIVERGNNLG